MTMREGTDMEKLNTIQKSDKLNEVYRDGKPGPGGAHHTYIIERASGSPAFLLRVEFQSGPRNVKSARDGVLDEDLLEIVRDRLRGFEGGDFACFENYKAIEHIEEALMWLNRRKEDRKERGVLGTYQK